MSCEQCTQGYVLDGEPEGTMVDGAYLRAAPTVEGAADAGTPKRAVVLLTDIFGLPLKNSKLVADEIARRVGCDVWVPDLFAPGACKLHLPLLLFANLVRRSEPAVHGRRARAAHAQHAGRADVDLAAPALHAPRAPARLPPVRHPRRGRRPAPVRGESFRLSLQGAHEMTASGVYRSCAQFVAKIKAEKKYEKIGAVG